MIQQLTLTNFRNYDKKTFDFGDKINVILGPNAIGKTNILEAIYLLSSGRSFKARKEEEMVKYDAEIARIKGIVDGRSNIADTNVNSQSTNYNLQPTNLEVVLTRGAIDIGAERPERVPRKKLMVNGIGRHLYNFVGNLKVVLFGPWDLDLVTESPSIRRNFLDSVLSQTDREYRRSILSYEKGLRQRNKLLFQIREEGISRNVLTFWNMLLVKHGDYIARSREQFINFANENNKFPISTSKMVTDFKLEYDRSVISESRLEQYREEELAAATTLVGPHRDDFQFQITNSQFQMPNEDKTRKTKARDLARYGSRGEQRIGVLWIKLAELTYIEDITKERPTLLLDDIFSELDHEHRDLVMEVCKNQQTVITTADPHFVENLKSDNIIRL